MKNDNPQSKKRIFIYEFVWTEALIKHVIQLCSEKDIEICGWAVRRKDMDRLRGVWPDAPIYESAMPSDLSLINFEFDLLNSFGFEEEENIHLLLDREGSYQNNMHSNQTRYEVYAWVKTVLKQAKPDWLLFSDVPHNIFSYLLHLEGKRLGKESLMIRMGLAPHLFMLSKTVERDFSPIDLQKESTEPSTQSIEFLKLLRHGSDVSPTYMKRQRRNSKPLQIVKRAMAKGSDLFTKKSMRAVGTHIKRRKIKQFYESVCEPNLDMTKPYVILFLHLQPERSTVPEGGIFAQQWLIVQMLSAACVPEGWNVYVKEHPSTFMVGPKLYRGKWFYNGLKLLPNVSLVSTSVDSGSLLENSKAVATVTGSVGIESVTKGIPALLFGETPRIGLTGTFRIKSQADLKAAISSIRDGVEIDFDDIKRFYSAKEKDLNCHNTGLAKTANHGASWIQGIPQTVMFSKMIDIVENEKLTSVNEESQKGANVLSD